VQTKVQNKTCTAHSSKQQANYESTKNANDSAEATKRCALPTTAKMIHELPPDMNKIIQILWADKLMTKARRIQIKVQKQQKYCAQQQK